MTTEYHFGFRIVGRTSEPRRLIDAVAGFAAYAATDDRAQIDREAYLSAFQFAWDFAEYLQRQQSVAGFAGPCWARWVWLDIDNKTAGGQIFAFGSERIGGLGFLFVAQCLAYAEPRKCQPDRGHRGTEALAGVGCNVRVGFWQKCVH